MMQEFKISVVIPNFNRSALLKRAVESALNQTYPVHEILVCDDGSTDNSRDIISQINNPKVLWLDCGKNGRPAIPRNTGIRNSTGNYIAFLDNDDYWHQEKIKKQIQCILEKKYRAVCTNAFRINEKKEIYGYLVSFQNDEVTFEDLTKGNLIVCSSLLVEKEFLTKISLFPEEPELKAYEDFALWVRLAHFSSIGFINEPLVYYTDMPDASIRVSNKKDGWDALKTAFDSYSNWARENNIKINKMKIIKKLYKKIKRKGQPTFLEELNRRIQIRIKKYLKI